jgi:hypothetical protein
LQSVRISTEALTAPIAQGARRSSIPILWMVTAFGVALGLAAAVLTIKGTDANGLVMGLRVTARWSFLLFWLAYTGRAMSELLGLPFAPLGRGREFGLAYAAAQLVHVGLVVWLFQISSSPPLSGKLFEFFLIGIVWTYLLAVLSFDHLAEALGPTGWRLVRIVAMNYILLAFAYDFVPPMIHFWTPHYGVVVEYAPFAAMCLGAPLLVIAAATHRRIRMRYRGASALPL